MLHQVLHMAQRWQDSNAQAGHLANQMPFDTYAHRFNTCLLTVWREHTACQATGKMQTLNEHWKTTIETLL